MYTLVIYMTFVVFFKNETAEFVSNFNVRSGMSVVWCTVDVWTPVGAGDPHEHALSPKRTNRVLTYGESEGGTGNEDTEYVATLMTSHLVHQCIMCRVEG